ncbi:MAG TPA: BlaI/MecI/CopY family transcriptional regulator, partial [Ruminiclostridium sp.]|nr:BlaI/MecI/CopY family transcriptional regulator [Ruminiclostridium sp.]
KTIKISDAEWQVMKVIWGKSPIASSEIVEILKPVTKWSPTTIYTLINRLVNKKAIAIEEGSSPNKCYPLISQQEFRQEESRNFLSRVYDGSLNLMLANIVEEQKLSDNEIDELKRILDESRKRK